MKLLLIIGSHLATAPRPQKEAAAAREAGWEVVVRGTWWSEEFAAEDLELAERLGIDFAPVADLRQGQRGRQALRMRQRIGRELVERFGLLTGRAFGVGGPELLRAARQIRPDLTMVHSEAGLWVARRLLSRGWRVGADFEDWFSADLPSSTTPRARIALRALEMEILRSASPLLATTEAMATALAEAAGLDGAPIAIPNAFPWSEGPLGGGFAERRDERDPEALSLYWFSQTIGPGRGLEALAEALAGVRGDWQLHLRGALRSHRGWFEATFPATVRSRIVLHDSVSNAELASATASHDIGLALESTSSPSRDLTATNKIFEYLRCGLGVIATDTRGQREVVARCPEAAIIVPPDEAPSLRSAIQRLIDDRAVVCSMKAASAEAGAGVWSWEGIRPRLQSALAAASRPEAAA